MTKGKRAATSGLAHQTAASYNLCMCKTPQKQKRQIRQTGFSLLEVLISIVILSFGLLGMVGLQAAALQGNRDARLQSTAISLARELAEMMRGNKDVALLTLNNPYFGDFASFPLAPAIPSYCLNVGSLPTACGASAAIAAPAIATAQMTEWLARVSNELPGAHVVVCVDAKPYNTSTGTPVWTCTPPAAGAAATSVIKIGWSRPSTKRANANDKSNVVSDVDAADRATYPSLVFPIIPGNVL